MPLPGRTRQRPDPALVAAQEAAEQERRRREGIEREREAKARADAEAVRRRGDLERNALLRRAERDAQLIEQGCRSEAREAVKAGDAATAIDALGRAAAAREAAVLAAAEIR